MPLVGGFSQRARTNLVFSRLLRVPPAAAIFGNVLLAAVGALLTLQIAVNQPWLGIEWQATEGQRGLLVASVAKNGPSAEALRAGQRIVAIESADGKLYLDGLDIIEEPDFLRKYKNFNALLSKQGQLHDTLASSHVTLHSARGKSISVTPTPLRPIADLPLAFWFQVIFAVACLGIGATVWAFQRTLAAAFFGTTGLGLFLVGLTAAIYSTRELALASPLFRILAAADHAGGTLFAAAFWGMLWYYPQRLTAFPMGRVSFLVFSLFWVLDTAQWLPSIDFGFRLPLLAGIIVSFVLAFFQWRQVESPLDRAALRWFLFVWFFGSSLFVVLMFLPILLGATPLLSQSYSFAVLLLIYVGVALGVARYRLFSLERWWYPMLSGSAALLAMLILLPLLARFAHLSQIATVLVCTGILGWVYFPVRAWFARRSAKHRRRRTVPVLDQTMKLLFDPKASSDTDVLWKTLLQKLFEPLELHPDTAPMQQVEVSRDGSTLCIPATAYTSGYALRWPERGARLFDEADIGTTITLLPLIESARDLRAAWEHGAVNERARIKRDLEDDLAPRLYGQILRAPSADAAASTRATLAEVRLVIDQLGTQNAGFAETLSGWRDQIQDLCEISQVPLRWYQPSELPKIRLDPQWQGNPLRILREAVTNGIDHARPTYMEVAISLDLPEIIISVKHDGADRAPESWEKGRGILNIEARAKQLSGVVQWSQSEPGSVKMQARLALEPAH